MLIPQQKGRVQVLTFWVPAHHQWHGEEGEYQAQRLHGAAATDSRGLEGARGQWGRRGGC